MRKRARKAFNGWRDCWRWQTKAAAQLLPSPHSLVFHFDEHQQWAKEAQKRKEKRENIILAELIKHRDKAVSAPFPRPRYVSQPLDSDKHHNTVCDCFSKKSFSSSSAVSAVRDKKLTRQQTWIEGKERRRGQAAKQTWNISKVAHKWRLS